MVTREKQRADVLDEATLNEVRAGVRGEIITPEDAGYESARKVHNGMIDRRPGVIIRCRDVADVIAGVGLARDNGLDLSVRGGGHSAPGFGTNDDGVVLDLSPMHGVRVDPERRVAQVQGGCTWGDLDHATHAFGLATTGGIISTTGVGGLTLGGGIGHLARGCGLSCDNLLSADVVLADGSLVTANEEENADLFWALRGGSGNFGVVVSFEFRLHPVGMIYGGPVVWDIDDAPQALRFWRDWLGEQPEELGCFFGFHLAPPLPFLPEERHGTNVALAVACWTGDPAEGEKVLKPLMECAPVVGDHVDVMPYPALNSAFDALVPPGIQQYWKASFADGFSDESVEAHCTHGAKVPSVSSAVHLYPIDGAPQRVGAEETAFSYRDASFSPVIAGMWPDPADNEENVQWVRDYYEAVRPYSQEGGYINFMSEDDQGRIRENYRGNYDRLARVKASYDPENLFHMNQNIRPQA